MTYTVQISNKSLPSFVSSFCFLVLILARGDIYINIFFSLGSDLNQPTFFFLSFFFFCWKETKSLYITKPNRVHCDERSNNNNSRRQKASHIEF